MEKLCDLHTHSTHSDGTFSPAQLIAAAQAAGLAAVALTDHNTVSGLPEFLEAARNSGVEAVPGAEFSTDYQDTELHILGLFIRPQHYETITAMMDDVLQRKERSNRELVEALNRTGYVLDYDTIKNRTPGGFVNRAHIAAELTRLGYTADRKEAFSKLLSPKCGYYQPPRRIDAFEMIRTLKSMGAVVVLAHPFLSLKEEDALRAFLGPAVEAGLDGMEVRYPLFDAEQTRAAEQLAEQFGLLPSGGSDFHGDNKPDIRLGQGKGGLNVPLSFLEGLKRRVGFV
jgi:predicted metal-dependent phosphoesterase TrpH